MGSARAWAVGETTSVRGSGAPRHVILCGISGAGKSTIGALAALALARPFFDVDKMIEAEAGTTVRAIFADEGEPAFRRRERAEVERALATTQPAVISLGGGALETDATFEDARAHTLVWLRAPVALIASRIRGNDRPLLAGDPYARLRALATAREPRYRQAHLRVDATPSPRRVAQTIVERVRALEAAESFA